MTELNSTSTDLLHIWACSQTTGSGEERTFIRELSAEEIELVRKDPEAVSKVCPNGRIVCRKCGIDFFGDPNKPGVNQGLVDNIVEGLEKKDPKG